MPNNRLKATLTTCAVAALGPLLAAPGGERAFVNDAVWAEVAGMGGFFLKSFSGAVAIAAPAIRGTTKEGYPDKSPGALTYEEAELQVGFTAPKGLWNWVGTFAAPSKILEREVVIDWLDHSLKSTSKRQLGPTTLSKVVFPACDGSSKEPTYVTLGLIPTRAREVAGSGTSPDVPTSSAQKNRLSANFRLTIDGIDTNGVSRIEPITIKHPASGNPDYSNLVVSMAEASSTSLRQWMNQVLNPSGKDANASVGASTERKGKLEFLSPNRQDVLLTLMFEGLGPVRLAAEKAEARTDSIRRVKAELYIEKLSIVAPES